MDQRDADSEPLLRRLVQLLSTRPRNDSPAGSTGDDSAGQVMTHQREALMMARLLRRLVQRAASDLVA